MPMVHLVRLGVGVFGGQLCICHPLRLLGWCHRMAAVGPEAHDADGLEHRNVDPRVKHSRDDYGVVGPQKDRRFEPPDVLGLIALMGLLIYALIRGMDATIAGMLTGLFGVLLGRVARKNEKP